MEERLKNLSAVFHLEHSSIKTDYTTRTAFIIGLVAIMITLVAQFLFMIWKPNYVFWTLLLTIFFMFIHFIFRHLRPLATEGKIVRKIIVNLNMSKISTSKEIIRVQEGIIDKIEREVLLKNSVCRKITDQENIDYYNRIYNLSNSLIHI